MYKLIIYKIVENAIDEIYDHIANVYYNKPSAKKIADTISANIEKLRLNPFLGQVINGRLSFPPEEEIRYLPILKKYLAFYRIVGGEVQVFRLAFASSNWTANDLFK